MYIFYLSLTLNLHFKSGKQKNEYSIHLIQHIQFWVFLSIWTCKAPVYGVPPKLVNHLSYAGTKENHLPQKQKDQHKEPGLEVQ